MTPFEKSLVTEAKAAVFSPDLNRARQNKSGGSLYIALMTASNFHLMLAELLKTEGNTSKAKYHMDLSNRMRSEASSYRAD